MRKTKKKKDEFVFLVYCNKEPIVYNCYKSKHDAVRHAVMLIRYRRDLAKQRNQTFGYYHFLPLLQPSQIRWMKDPESPCYHDTTVFTACLKIEKQENEIWSEDGCNIRVIRRVLN